MKLSDKDKHLIILGAAFVLLGGYVAISRTGAPGTGPSGMPSTSQNPKRGGLSANLTVSRLASANVAAGLDSGVSADVNMLGIDAKGGLTMESMLLHYFHPEGPLPLNPPNQQYTNTKQRYPTVTGTNINTLIHHGYSPLMVPTPRDYSWIVNPPADSYFGG